MARHQPTANLLTRQNFDARSAHAFCMGGNRDARFLHRNLEVTP